MAAGMATVIGHDVRSGGALPVVVTMLGWLMPIKGIMLMAVTSRALRAFYRVARTPKRLRWFLDTT